MQNVKPKSNPQPTTMLYKYPGPHRLHGDYFDYVVVQDQDIEAALSDGWHRTTGEAKAAAQGKAKKSKAKAVITDELD